MQKRATLQPPHKQNIRTAPLRGGRYQPINRTRCKLVMTVSLIGISKEKKNLSRTSRENVPTFLKICTNSQKICTNFLPDLRRVFFLPAGTLCKRQLKSSMMLSTETTMAMV